MACADHNEGGLLPLDGILIINPRDFVDRRQSIERQLQALGLKYEFIHSFDAGDLDTTITSKYITSAFLSPGQQSCALKHLQALRLIVERNWQRALVLEDDAILASRFVQGLQAALEESAPLEAPYVLLVGSGGNQYTPRRRRVPGQCLYRADRGRLTEAYVLGSQTARLRVDWIERHGISLPIDNLFDRMDRELNIARYWLEPPIVEQGSKNGQFRSVLEPAPPNFVRRVTSVLQKLRRKYLY
ncbi:glycosyltransferase family 25 protein [Nitrospira sp. NS4]|uniref:glycosyltransferase family 25 protein n=1 Tax=Nitrospira sp. NS4 TaxID=3414498 RepID=UPI003C2E194D